MPALCLRLVSEALRCPKISYFRFHFTLMRFILSQIYKVKDESSGVCSRACRILLFSGLKQTARLDHIEADERVSGGKCNVLDVTPQRASKADTNAADLNTLCPSVCLLFTPNVPQLQTNVWMTAQIRVYPYAKIHIRKSTQQKQKQKHKRIVSCLDWSLIETLMPYD